MERELVLTRLDRARVRLQAHDAHLLENDLSERCIAARLAMYLQAEFTEEGISVDVEYNRLGAKVKRLKLPAECVTRKNREVDPAALPDIIVHHRGKDGPNILVVEIKKTSNPAPRNCDAIRVRCFREQLGYEYGALIECVTDGPPEVRISQWVG